MDFKFTHVKRFFTDIRQTVYLYKNIWKEHSTALLRAPRETDKTALALDIAAQLSSAGRSLLYVNVEGHLEDFPDRASAIDNMLVFNPEFSSPDNKMDYADLVIAGIEEAVATTDIRTFIIDSVSRIAALSFGKNASVAYVMKRLVALQTRFRLSFLIISHDSTKATDRALTGLAASTITVSADLPETQQPVFMESRFISCDSKRRNSAMAESVAVPTPEVVAVAFANSRRERRAAARAQRKIERKMRLRI